jgi:GDP-L-fucose synthase
MSQAPKIYVAGHRGMVGLAILRQLQAPPCGSGAPAANVITRTHVELDLTNQAAVQAFFAEEKPDQVYIAAAKVGGIHANNTYPAEFIYDNRSRNTTGRPHQSQAKARLGARNHVRPND